MSCYWKSCSKNSKTGKTRHRRNSCHPKNGNSCRPRNGNNWKKNGHWNCQTNGNWTSRTNGRNPRRWSGNRTSGTKSRRRRGDNPPIRPNAPCCRTSGCRTRNAQRQKSGRPKTNGLPRRNPSGTRPGRLPTNGGQDRTRNCGKKPKNGPTVTARCGGKQSRGNRLRAPRYSLPGDPRWRPGCFCAGAFRLPS